MRFIVTKDDTDKEIADAVRGITRALELAVKDTAKLAVKQGRANIAAAGFSSRWQRGVKSKFYANRRTGNPAAVISDRMPFVEVFEKGADITGKPLLWLPVEKNLPKGVKSPRQYGRKLVSVNVSGKPPMLFDPNNRLLGPLFIGTRSVHIRKRFDLVRVWTEAASHLDEFLEQRLRELDNA